MVNCNECKFINLTEEEQNNKYEDHICLKHQRKLLHMSCDPRVFHGHIHPCVGCAGEDFEART